jgi:hypothetical protein
MARLKLSAAFATARLIAMWLFDPWQSFPFIEKTVSPNFGAVANSSELIRL